MGILEGEGILQLGCIFMVVSGTLGCAAECGEQGKGDSLPLCSALGRPHLEDWSQCWALQLQADWKLLGEACVGCRAVREVVESSGEIQTHLGTFLCNLLW